MQTNTQTHTTSTETWIMAACFSRFPFSVPRRQGTWGTLDSECLNLHCLKDSGTKIMAFQCDGHRCEWCFLKHQSSDDLPEAVLTVDSHCQYTCKVCAQCQSSISCVAELLTSRHSICVSKLSKHSALSLIPKAPASSVLCFALWVMKFQQLWRHGT